jgi:hypothetical protein
MSLHQEASVRLNVMQSVARGRFEMCCAWLLWTLARCPQTEDTLPGKIATSRAAQLEERPGLDGINVMLLNETAYSAWRTIRLLP